MTRLAETKAVSHWYRWLFLAPAFFIGLNLCGPLMVGFAMQCFHIHVEGHLFIFLCFFLAFSVQSFAVTLFCAWIAPIAKKLVGGVTAFLCFVVELTLKGSAYLSHGHESSDNWSSNPLIIAAIGYACGAGMAQLCLYWILSQRTDSSKEISPEQTESSTE